LAVNAVVVSNFCHNQKQCGTERVNIVECSTVEPVFFCGRVYFAYFTTFSRSWIFSYLHL